MPKALFTFDFTPKEPASLKSFAYMLRKLYEQLVRIVNGQLSFGKGIAPDNIAGAWGAVADTGTANTDFTITHNLLYVPTGFIVMNQTLAGVIYKGSVPWTTTQLHYVVA